MSSGKCGRTTVYQFNFKAGSSSSLSSSSQLIATAQAAPAVPEPATWAMMLLGFGAVGAAMRRRETAVAST